MSLGHIATEGFLNGSLGLVATEGYLGEGIAVPTGKSGVNRLKEINRLNRIREEDDEIIKIVALLVENGII